MSDQLQFDFIVFSVLFQKQLGQTNLAELVKLQGICELAGFSPYLESFFPTLGLEFEEPVYQLRSHTIGTAQETTVCHCDLLTCGL